MDAFVRRMLATTAAKPSPPMLLSVAFDCVESWSTTGGECAKDVSELTAFLTAINEATLDAVSVAVCAARVRGVLTRRRGWPTAVSIEQHLRQELETQIDAMCIAWSAMVRHVVVAGPAVPDVVVATSTYAAALLHQEFGVATDLMSEALECVRTGGNGMEVTVYSAVRLLDSLVTAMTALGQSASTTTLFLEQDGSVNASTKAIIDACFEFLSQPQLDLAIPPLVTRKLLIPLLMTKKSGGEGSSVRLIGHEYIARIHSLLATLYDRRLLAEATVTIAALFDFLFSFNDDLRGKEADSNDFRRSCTLWNIVRDALEAALESDCDAGKRTTMQLQVTYLLKRIVSLSQGERRETNGVETDAAATAAAAKTGKKHVDPVVIASDTATTTIDVFHPYFPWNSAVSGEAWNQFFLAFETLNEYGVHINAPALAKLDSVLLGIEQGGFSMTWVELLLSKGLRHANTGIRKLILRKLWAFPASRLHQLSRRLVCQIAFVTAADVRLCSDLDRVVLPGTFLECKVFAGREDYSLPKVSPLAESMATFYVRFINCKECCPSLTSQVEAMMLLIHSVDVKAPRFMVAALLRVLWYVARHIEPRMTDSDDDNNSSDSALIRLTAVIQMLLKELVHDRHPFWLEARLNAMVLDTLLHLGAHVGKRLYASAQFRTAIALCSARGETGGRSVAIIDASGSSGCIGSALPVPLAAKRIVGVLSTPSSSSSSRDSAAMADTLLHLSDLSLILRERLSHPPVTPFEPSWSKEHMMGVSQLQPAVFQDVWLTIVSSLESCSARSYMQAKHVCDMCALFVDCARFSESTLSTVAALTTMDSLGTILSFLRSFMSSAIRRAQDALFRGEINTFDDFNSPDGEEGLWDALRTIECDSIAAAISVATAIMIHKKTSVDDKDTTRPPHAPVADSPFVFMYDCLSGTLEQLSGVLREKERVIQAASCSSRVFSPAAHFGHVIICRSLARIAHAMLSAFAEQPMALETHLHDALSFSSRAYLIELIRDKCLQLHLGATDTPTSLSAASWGAVMSQYFRYLYNIVYCLCVSTLPDLSNALQQQPPTVTEETARTFVADIETLALDQLDRCSTSNQSCLYDLVSWTILSRTSPLLRDHDDMVSSPESRVRGLLTQIDDTQRREYFRCSAVTLASLRHCEDRAFVRKTVFSILNDESESERVVFFCSTMVCAAVLADPQGAWPEYRELLLYIAVLYNSGRDEEDMEGCLAVTEPAMCADGFDQLMENVPASVRLASVARAMAISVILRVCSSDSTRAIELSTELVRWNVSNATVAHEPCMPNSKAHRCRIRLWQLLCSILPTLNPSENWEVLVQLVIKVAVPINNMGSVRRFIELYLIGIVLRNPKQLYPLLGHMLDRYELRPQIIGSYALVAVHVLLHGQMHVEGLFDCIFPKLVRMCGSNQHLLRIIAHIGVHQCIKDRSVKCPNWKPQPEVQALFDFIDVAPESIKFREKHQEMVIFDTLSALEPRQLFCIQRKETQVWLRESIPALSFERVRFLERELSSVLGAVTPFETLRSRVLVKYYLGCNIWNEKHEDSSIPFSTLEEFDSFPYIPHSKCISDRYVDYTLEAMEAVAFDELQASEEVGGGGQDNIQRKVTSWWNSEVFNALHPRALGGNERQTLIVVGSLLENPVNIAGLCRCAEIFTVEKVIVPDKKVFEHPHFVATARSAELWTPWDEVRPMDLTAYLQRMRQEGYVIVGIEQTADSVSMATYTFPERVVMVLGSEGQGIPPEYLPYVDVCVEIPQYGLIRSLNVHVTGAIVMYEFTKQHLMIKNARGAQSVALGPTQSA